MDIKASGEHLDVDISLHREVFRIGIIERVERSS